MKNAVLRKNLTIDLHQRHRGEEDIVVAGASILARAAFLEGMEQLSQEYSLKLPKGASEAVKDTARTFIAKFGQSALSKVAKTHFKTTLEL